MDSKRAVSSGNLECVALETTFCCCFFVRHLLLVAGVVVVSVVVEMSQVFVIYRTTDEKTVERGNCHVFTSVTHFPPGQV